MASHCSMGPPKKGGQSHQCSSGLGRDCILGPSQQKGDLQGGHKHMQVWDSRGEG